MSGMVINGERPLDLAAERDPRIDIEGDVHLLLALPSRMEHIPQRSSNMQQVGTGTVEVEMNLFEPCHINLWLHAMPY